VINSEENWIPGELYNEQAGNIQIKVTLNVGGGGWQDPLLRGKCPKIEQ
jgi:hypothetical protein